MSHSFVPGRSRDDKPQTRCWTHPTNARIRSKPIHSEPVARARSDAARCTHRRGWNQATSMTASQSTNLPSSLSVSRGCPLVDADLCSSPSGLALNATVRRHSDCAIPTPKADAAHSCSVRCERHCRCHLRPQLNPGELRRALPSVKFPSPNACQPVPIPGHGLPPELHCSSRLKPLGLAPLGFPNHAPQSFRGCRCEPERPEPSCG